MIRRLANLPFRVLTRAARAFQDHQDTAARADHPSDESDETESQNIPQFDTPDDFLPEDLAVTADEIRRARQRGVAIEFVDVRTERAQRRSPLPNALHLPLASLGISLAELPPANVRVLVVADRDTDAQVAARFLRWRGFEDCGYIVGGTAAYLQAQTSSP